MSMSTRNSSTILLADVLTDPLSAARTGTIYTANSGTIRRRSKLISSSCATEQEPPPPRSETHNSKGAKKPHSSPSNRSIASTTTNKKETKTSDTARRINRSNSSKSKDKDKDKDKSDSKMTKRNQFVNPTRNRDQTRQMASITYDTIQSLCEQNNITYVNHSKQSKQSKHNQQQDSHSSHSSHSKQRNVKSSHREIHSSHFKQKDTQSHHSKKSIKPKNKAVMDSFSSDNTPTEIRQGSHSTYGNITHSGRSRSKQEDTSKNSSANTHNTPQSYLPMSKQKTATFAFIKNNKTTASTSITDAYNDKRVSLLQRSKSCDSFSFNPEASISTLFSMAFAKTKNKNSSKQNKTCRDRKLKRQKSQQDILAAKVKSLQPEQEQQNKQEQHRRVEMALAKQGSMRSLLQQSQSNMKTDMALLMDNSSLSNNSTHYDTSNRTSETEDSSSGTWIVLDKALSHRRRRYYPNNASTTTKSERRSLATSYLNSNDSIHTISRRSASDDDSVSNADDKDNADNNECGLLLPSGCTGDEADGKRPVKANARTIHRKIGRANHPQRRPGLRKSQSAVAFSSSAAGIPSSIRGGGSKYNKMPEMNMTDIISRKGGATK